MNRFFIELKGCVQEKGKWKLRAGCGMAAWYETQRGMSHLTQSLMVNVNC